MPIKKKLKSRAVRSDESPDFESVVKRIVPVDEASGYRASLFYGRSGTGKTTLAASWPTPILFLDMREKGTEVAIGTPDVDVLKISHFADLEAIYWYLKSKQNKYATVNLDTVTQMQELAKVMTLEERGAEPEDQVSKRDWGGISGKMSTWLMNYRDLVDDNIHVNFLAHDRTSSNDEYNEGDIMPEVGARLMPSVATLLNGGVSIIGQTFIREVVIGKNSKGKADTEMRYGLRVSPHNMYTTKIRVRRGSEVPEYIYNPTYGKLMKVIRGESLSKPKKGPIKRS